MPLRESSVRARVKGYIAESRSQISCSRLRLLDGQLCLAGVSYFQYRSSYCDCATLSDTLKHAKALSSRQEQERTAERESVDHFKRQLVAEDSALRRQERLSKERQLLQTFQVAFILGTVILFSIRASIGGTDDSDSSTLATSWKRTSRAELLGPS